MMGGAHGLSTYADSVAAVNLGGTAVTGTCPTKSVNHYVEACVDLACGGSDSGEKCGLGRQIMKTHYRLKAYEDQTMSKISAIAPPSLLTASDLLPSKGFAAPDFHARQWSNSCPAAVVDALKAQGIGYLGIPVDWFVTDMDKHCNLHHEDYDMMMHYTPQEEIEKHLNYRGCSIVGIVDLDDGELAVLSEDSGGDSEGVSGGRAVVEASQASGVARPGLVSLSTEFDKVTVVALGELPDFVRSSNHD